MDNISYILWLAELSSTLKFTTGFVSLILGGINAIMTIGLLCDDLNERQIRYYKIIVSVMVVTLLLCVTCPSSKTMNTMIAMSVDGYQPQSETGRKALVVINQRIDEFIAEGNNQQNGTSK